MRTRRPRRDPWRHVARVLLGLCLAGPWATVAQTTASPAIAVGDAWIRLPPPGAPIAAGYLRISNRGDRPDRLLAAATAVAERVELHRHRLDDGVMRMRRLRQPLELPPAQTVEFAPGGLHLMLLGLRRELRAGVPVRVTLQLEQAGTLEVEFAVRR